MNPKDELNQYTHLSMIGTVLKSHPTHIVCMVKISCEKYKVPIKLDIAMDEVQHVF